jgi:simple sugar transport system substrate-binding protein
MKRKSSSRFPKTFSDNIKEVRMFKNVSRIVSVVALLSILLAACGAPASTQAPAAPVTQAPAVPVLVPTASQAPAATEGAAPAAAGGWCSGVKIVFFPGGPQGGVFAVNVYNGAVQAAADLGASVSYEWSNWDQATMIQQFQEAAATKPDGIAVMGHPTDASYDPLIDAAEAQGIIVTSQNSELPLAQAKYAAKGFGYVGANNYNAGLALGTEAVMESGVKAGDRALVWGLLSQGARGQRTQGVIDAFKKAGLKQDYIEIDKATNADPTQGTATFTGYVSAHPDVKLIVTDHGGLTATVGTYMQAANKKPGDIFMAGFDMSPATADAITSGYENLVIDQQEWLQGYLPILQICLTKVYGFSGLYINTGAGFVNKDNVAMIAPLAAKNIR